MKMYVLFYKIKTSVDGKYMSLHHFKYFVTKDELSKFLSRQGLNFTPLAVQKLNVSNTMLVEKHFDVLKKVSDEHSIN